MKRNKTRTNASKTPVFQDDSTNRNVDSDSPLPSPAPIHFPASMQRKRITMAGEDTMKHVQRVSTRAALTTKRKIWDSNDASIALSLSAVDRWEALYKQSCSILATTAKSAVSAFDAAKQGVELIENDLLVPVRDHVLLPTFANVEHAVSRTVDFLHSEQASNLTSNSIEVVRKVPFGVGDKVLAPVLISYIDFLKVAWSIVQYPIPSRDCVVSFTDGSMTATKLMVQNTAESIYFYAKIVDATFTRTLMHSQWRLLGSGPYATLDEVHQSEVIDHICERYLSLTDKSYVSSVVSRFELISHIKFHNGALHSHLVDSGLLYQRGGDLLKDDFWLLDQCPHETALKYASLIELDALWFYLPYQNGKKPPRESPWILFTERDRRQLDEKYMKKDESNLVNEFNSNRVTGPSSTSFAAAGDMGHFTEYKSNYPNCAAICEHKNFIRSDPSLDNAHPSAAESEQMYTQNHEATCWYNPNSDDVLVDQKRHAVSFSPNKRFVMRPTLWRFFGPGNDVRRGVWLLETKRHGLQPYPEYSTRVLEDAYRFLKWHVSSKRENKKSRDKVLLTVQVIGPDGEEQQLVQFRSVTKIVALQKSLCGALKLFKMRVYRGVKLEREEKKSVTKKDCLDKDDVSKENYLDQSEELNHKLRDSSTSVLMKGIESLAVPISVDIEEDISETKKSGCNKSELKIEEQVDHLILVVHGVGEMQRNTEVLGMSLPPLSSITNCCGWLRKNHDEVAALREKHIPSSVERSAGRVEYIPIEWHEEFCKRKYAVGKESTHSPSLQDISLDTIPHLREFANDTLLDVLYFMSPEHHDLIIDIVTKELNLVVSKFRHLNQYFFPGRISMLCHSLGSVVSWDILSHQESFVTRSQPREISSRTVPLFTNRRPKESNEYRLYKYPQLEFQVSNFFMIGSPLAVFLMIRNQHQPMDLNYSLPGCKRLFNIFHPYDPAAYRIEPLLDRKNAALEPEIITNWNGGFRVQYRTKILWQKIIDQTCETQREWMKKVESGMRDVGLLDDDSGQASPKCDKRLNSLEIGDVESISSVRCGKLNEGRRVDYMLQEKEIENANEYVFAIGAHSAYWDEKDLASFIAQEIWRGENGNST
mmetsp:Transcript_40386/g.47253  ORF Transcript_40386/g.47253 Transcript_40386/m.47253 type:complete len:1103 (+) Transcript_40386:217-3525(+)